MTHCFCFLRPPVRAVRGWILALALLIGGVAPPAHAEVADVNAGASGNYVDVVSSTAGIQIGPGEIRTGLRFRVKAGAATGVCINYVDRDVPCASGLTSPDNAGHCLNVGDTYLAMVHDEHWRGKVCAILPTGSTSVRVPWNAW